MAIATVEDLTGALPGIRRSFGKASFTPQAIGAFIGLWNIGNLPPAAGVPAPGVAGAVPTKDTAGAVPFSNPGAGDTTYLARLAAMATSAGTLHVFDRLWHNSGLSPTTLTAQTVNSVALTRPDALGANVEAWLEVNTALGAGSTPPSISYTDQDGNAGNSASLMAFVATAAAGRNFPFGLAGSDTGIRSIQTYTNGATMTSGTFSLVLRRRIAEIDIPAGGLAEVLDFFALGGPQIDDDAALEFVWFGAVASATQVFGSLTLAQT